MPIPPYPTPIPSPPRPQIKTLSAGEFSQAGGPFTVTVETCEPAPTVQVDAADIPLGEMKIENNKGSISAILPGGLDPGLHMITVTDANGVSDAMQIFVSV